MIHYLADIRSLRNIPILVNSHPHIREILELLYPGRAFIYCPEGRFVRVTGKALYLTPPVRNGGEHVEASIRSFRRLRSRVLEAAGLDESRGDTTPGRHVFFSRKNLAGNHSGGTRVLVNERDVQEALVERGWDLRTFDGLTLVEKARSLADVDVVMTASGANLTNLIFASRTQKLVIIGHPTFRPEEWFYALYGQVGVSIAKAFNCFSVSFADQANVHYRAPFRVDLDALLAAADDICR